MIEALLSMFIVAFIATSMLQVNKVLLNTLKKDVNVDIPISIMALQELLAKSEILAVNDASIEILLNNQNYLISYKNNCLVKEDGYEILVERISEGYFYMQDQTLYMQFSRKGVDFEYPVAKKEWWRY